MANPHGRVLLLDKYSEEKLVMEGNSASTEARKPLF